jgi:hypothetical protein
VNAWRIVLVTLLALLASPVAAAFVIHAAALILPDGSWADRTATRLDRWLERRGF